MPLDQCSVNMYADDTAFYTMSYVKSYSYILFNLIYVILVNGWMQTN